MRTANAFKNMISTLISHFTSMIFGFITQGIFVKILGTEYLGINGLFTNIISMLGVAELGFGSAIIYNLYKPIAENNTEKIKSLMNFYKKCYRIIALIITIIGILIIPTLKMIVGDTTVSHNMVLIIYILFIVDIVCSYLLTYKRSMLYANQKNYIIDIIHIMCLIILNFAQIIILLNTKNYILYLVFKIFMRLLENIIITIIVNKKYKYLKEKSCKELDKKTFNDIIKKVKGLFIHKLGVFFVAGTDNILISTFLGVSSVGLYSNYNIIINALATIINQIFSSFKSSIGNLLVTDDIEKSYNVYKKLQFLNFWFAMMSSIGIFIVMESFIKVWIGEQYILSKLVLIVLCFSNYSYISKLCTGNFKEAAGIFYEDKHVPIIESIVNISMSVIMLKIFGLSGVFMGTICSHMIAHIYTYPKFVYKKVFNKEYIQYFKDAGKYLVVTIVLAIITYMISTLIKVNSNILQLILNILTVLIIPNIFVMIIFHRTEEFKYYLELMVNNSKKTIQRIKKKYKMLKVQ